MDSRVSLVLSKANQDAFQRLPSAQLTIEPRVPRCSLRLLFFTPLSNRPQNAFYRSRTPLPLSVPYAIDLISDRLTCKSGLPSLQSFALLTPPPRLSFSLRPESGSPVGTRESATSANDGRPPLSTNRAPPFRDLRVRMDEAATTSGGARRLDMIFYARRHPGIPNPQGTYLHVHVHATYLECCRVSGWVYGARGVERRPTAATPPCAEPQTDFYGNQDRSTRTTRGRNRSHLHQSRSQRVDHCPFSVRQRAGLLTLDRSVYGKRVLRTCALAPWIRTL